MAQKSKTQRAKASARRAARKAEKARIEAQEQASAETGSDAIAAPSEEPAKRRLFKKADKEQAAGDDKKQVQKSEKKSDKADKKPKKRRFAFLKDVKAEMKRVTWPSKQEVLRWSGVVIVALLFFGIFAYIIDSISLLILTGISGLGAS